MPLALFIAIFITPWEHSGPVGINRVSSVLVAGQTVEKLLHASSLCPWELFAWGCHWGLNQILFWEASSKPEGPVNWPRLCLLQLGRPFVLVTLKQNQPEVHVDQKHTPMSTQMVQDRPADHKSTLVAQWQWDQSSCHCGALQRSGSWRWTGDWVITQRYQTQGCSDGREGGWDSEQDSQIHTKQMRHCPAKPELPQTTRQRQWPAHENSWGNNLTSAWQQCLR